MSKITKKDRFETCFKDSPKTGYAMGPVKQGPVKQIVLNLKKSERKQKRKKGFGRKRKKNIATFNVFGKKWENLKKQECKAVICIRLCG